jgi:SnoaL-like domain
MMTTKEIADRLVELCRSGKNLEAIDTLSSEKIVSVEAMGNEAMPAVMEGLAAVRGKNEWWIANHEVHSATVEGPYPNGDRFAVIFEFEVTPKAGPQSGKRTKMKEVALYTAQDGKIVREEFFYSMG